MGERLETIESPTKEKTRRKKMKTLHEVLGWDFFTNLNEKEQAKYPDGFFRWLQYNNHIWNNFEKNALRMAAKQKRYSARTIIEVIRWSTDIAEQASGGKTPLFKISNNMVPGLARLWMAKYGKNHPKFFQLQEK